MSSKTLPPGETLGYEPEITGEADVAKAMGELAWLAARGAEIEAECKRKVEAAKAAAIEAMCLDVGRWSISFADREAVLMQALEAYCTAHQDELLAGKRGRTREFTHGTIAWKKTPAGPAIDGALKPRELVDSFVGRHALKGQFHAWLQSIEIQPGVTAADFFGIELALRLDRAKEGVECGRLSEAELALVGLMWDKGADKFTFKPAKQVVRTETNLPEVA